MLLFAPMAAADEFRGALYPNVYSLRPGNSEEAAAITKHAAALGARKLAILHANDGESLAALDSAHRTMTSMGANLLASAAFSSGALAGGVDKALAPGAESILVIGDFQSAASVVREMRAKGFRGPIYGFSNTGESLLAEQLGKSGAGVVVARVVPKVTAPRLRWCVNFRPMPMPPSWTNPMSTWWKVTSPRACSPRLCAASAGTRRGPGSERPSRAWTTSTLADFAFTLLKTGSLRGLSNGA
nr:ABC transporter substrate-binding protein [Polaromonas eurypsychrophila]